MQDLPIEMINEIAGHGPDIYYKLAISLPVFGRSTLGANQKVWQNKFTVYTVDENGQSWKLAGNLHRDNDEPAIIHANGDQEWWRYGQLHRDNGGPAIIRHDGIREWYRDGVLVWYEHDGDDDDHYHRDYDLNLLESIYYYRHKGEGLYWDNHDNDDE